MVDIFSQTAMRGSKLLLHTCCAPCLSAVCERLRDIYEVTVFFYNPNITDEDEYNRRQSEVIRLLGLLDAENEEKEAKDAKDAKEAKEAKEIKAVKEVKAGFPISFLPGAYEPGRFYEAVGEDASAYPEGGARCERCYALRLGETWRVACEKGFDCFATTLTLSPHKNAGKINEIGALCTAQEASHPSPTYLASDFKKKNGYLRSLELSKKYGLYRQNYCGCEYSRKEL